MIDTAVEMPDCNYTSVNEKAGGHEITLGSHSPLTDLEGMKKAFLRKLGINLHSAIAV